MKTTKMRRRAISLVGLAMVSAMAVTACGSEGSGSGGSGAAEGDGITIGWANPAAKQPIFANFTEALEAGAKREGIKVITMDAKGDPATQVSNIQTLITKKVDVVIDFPISVEAETNVLSKAQDAGIKVIGFNAILPSKYGDTPKVTAPFDANLDSGFVDAFYVSGNFVSQQLKGKGNVLGVKFQIPVPALEAQVAAYKKGVTEDSPGINWLGTVSNATDDLAGGRQAVEDAITRYSGDIQGVLSYTDDAAVGAYQALSAAGIDDVVIVGQQGAQFGVDAVKAGKIQATINGMPYTQAVWFLQMAKDIVKGTDYPKFARLPLQFVTADNVDAYVPWADGLADIKSGKTSLDVTLTNTPIAKG